MKTKALVSVALGILFAMGASAQEIGSRFGLEISTGVSFPVKNTNAVDLKIGYGYECTLQYNFLSFGGIYGGWGWNELNTSNDGSIEALGYQFGIQLQIPVEDAPFRGYLRAGGLVNKLEVEDPDGVVIEETRQGLGWQLAGGIEFPLAPKWSLTPGFKFSALSRDMELNAGSGAFKYNYISAKVGIVRYL